MNSCSGCRMNDDLTKCLFQSDLYNNFINIACLKECPCLTCIVKSTCTFKYCQNYEEFYNKIEMKYIEFKLSHLDDPINREKSFCMIRILKFL